MRSRGKLGEGDRDVGEEGWKVSDTEVFPVTRSAATPPAHRDTGEGFGGNVARLCSWAAQELGPGGGRTAGARRGWNLDYRSPTVVSARAGQGRERSGQTRQSVFSTCISEGKEGIQDRQEGVGEWRWFQMRACNSQEERGSSDGALESAAPWLKLEYGW